MKVQVTPDTVKRERFGGIVGKVRAVSPLPITKDGVSAVIGNQEATERLLSESPCIEVTVALEPDQFTFSGLRWTSSRGPQVKISPGTTAMNRVTVEERAPVTYLLPFLRYLSGIY
jgi:HlyD family secretion protein